jgi:putative acetyltransferase
MPDPNTIRRADVADAAAVARLFREVRTTSLPFLPDLHAPDEDLRFFRDHVFRDCEVWVAGSNGDPVGFCAFREGWVDHLYIKPTRQRRGIGSLLLAKAMARYSPLRLWAFQRNVDAIRFYLRHGFHEIERTDGSRNEEHEPDVLLAWHRANAPSSQANAPSSLA